MIRVGLSGIFYPMAILRYFENALKRREDVELFTVGPFSGRQIPWGGGILLPGKYAKSPDLRLPFGGGVPIHWVEKCIGFELDLWIQVDAGFHLGGKPKHGINTIIATDPHVLNYTVQRKSADVFFCMQQTYSEPGDVYLPYAYDPVWHAPVDSVEKEWDTVLLGLHYEPRNLLVEQLEECGISVKYGLGLVFTEAREVYERARIGLNWSSILDLNARVFEIMGMGLPLVTNRVSDMDLHFEDGKHYLGFDHVEGAVRAVKTLLEDAELADRIAKAGHEKVKPHTYDARIAQILEEVGLG